jgi:hypothetical protein
LTRMPYRAVFHAHHFPGLAPRALLFRAFSATVWLGLTRTPSGAKKISFETASGEPRHMKDFNTLPAAF